jgi:hypothetical protein
MTKPEDAIRRFLRVTSNEFLRFNDLKPSSSPEAWWLSVAALIAITFVAISFQWLFDQFLPDASFAIEQLSKALLAFFIIPVASAFLRRLSDTKLLSPMFNVWFGLRKGSLGSRAAFWGLGVAIASLAAYLVFVLPFWGLSGLLILALLPESGSAKGHVPTTAHANIKLPPTLGATPPTLGGPPPAAPSSPQSTPSFTRSQAMPEPSKKLLTRVGFWLSIALALLTLLAPLQQDVQRFVEEIQTPAVTEEPQETQDPSPSPTQSPTASPTASPVTSSPATDSAGVGVGAGAGVGNGDDDSLIVVPVEQDPDVSSLDPRFRYCTHAIASGYGPYVYGVDPEYDWYNDRDGDGIVCER